MNEGIADTQNRKEMKGRKRESNYFLFLEGKVDTLLGSGKVGCVKVEPNRERI